MGNEMLRPMSRHPFSYKLGLYLWLRGWNHTKPQPMASMQGFTIVEVIAGLMMTLIFIAITMQVLMVAALFQARTDQFNQAVNWIQEDYETVFHQATQYEMTAQPYSPRCQATHADQGLAAGFLNDQTQGLGGQTASLGPRLFGGRSFRLLRTGSYTNSAEPHKLLELTYGVIPEDGDTPIAQFRTEVLIYAALQCPN